MGTLYIVSTPIGNLQDISFRAIRILSEVEIIVCEDTRRTGNLLRSLSDLKLGTGIEIRPRLISYYEQNEIQRIPQIIDLLKNGSQIALVSDSGTPTISDPGFKLVRECSKQNIKVETVPGSSSVISSLVVSGLPTDKFLFIGFLPKKQGHRKKLLENIQKSQDIIKSTVILFEAPHRLIGMLEELKEVFGDIEIVICRELTKIHEEIRREKISESLMHFEKTNPKGEFVILFNQAVSGVLSLPNKSGIVPGSK